MTAPVILASRLDLTAAPGLLAKLREIADTDIDLDFSGVTYFGALCLQVILAAATTARANGHRVSLLNTSDRVLEQMRVMGFSPESITKGRQ